jgi:hypothetical protein
MLLFMYSFSFGQQQLPLDSLTKLLEKVQVDDQQYREHWDSLMQQYGINSPEFIDLIRKMNRQDSVNMQIVGSILDKYGWLGRQQTSADANEAFFLVLQHATLQAQLKYLPVMKKAVAQKKAKASDYALLVDRTNMFQGRLQVYGSQLNYDAAGKVHIYPIMDEPNVNKRRKMMGLPPMQAYLQLFSPPLMYTVPATDKYKNKIIVWGSVRHKDDNQPVAGVLIYTGKNRLIAKSAAGGFYQLLLNKNVAGQNLHFKKKQFTAITVKLDAHSKQVIEINPVLAESTAN